MHIALLAATLAAAVNSATPAATAAPAPAASVSAPAAAGAPSTVAANTPASSSAAVTSTGPAPKHRRPAWEPPGYPLDDAYVASLLQSMPRSGDGGG